MPVKICKECGNEVWCDCYSENCNICGPYKPYYNVRLHQAFEAASLVHKGQERKNPVGVPFVSHCFAVYDLVHQYTNDEDTLIAALLHDAIEDNEEIGMQVVLSFGDDVLEYVQYVTEPPKYDDDGNKIKWRQRKSMYAKKLKYAPLGAKMISAADKIHNINSLLIAHRAGVNVWKMMTTNAEDQISRYQELVEALSNNWSWSHPLLKQLKSDLDFLSQLV